MGETHPGSWWAGVTPIHQASCAAAQRTAHELGRALAGAHSAEHDVGITAAAGATLARDVRARCPVPHYSSSAMDGYAVRGEGPWNVISGDPARHDAAATAAVTLSSGQAVPVVTGGVIPVGTETVIRTEYALRSGNELRFDESRPRRELNGAHLRPAGTECAEGEVILAAGTVLSPADLAFAAVAAVDTVPVVPAPSVRILLTGSEVQSSGVPAPGFVRDAFSPAFPSALTALGARVESIGRVPDDAQAFRAALDEALAQRVPLVVTTGGTARSSADHVRAHLERHALPIIDELDLQPGHPTLVAACSPGTAVLALPGNPLAAMTALTLLGVPLLRGMLERPAPQPRTVRVREAVDGARRHRLVPAIEHHDGLWSPCSHVGANVLRGLSRADGLLSVPEQGLDRGARTVVLDLPW